MMTPPFPSSPQPAASQQPARRRFRAADLSEHLDWAAIGNLCLGLTLPTYTKLLAEVFAQASGSKALLLNALQAGHPEAIREPAHSFKGETATVGLQSLAALALRFEQQGAGFTPSECQAAAEELTLCWDTVQALCQRMGLLSVASV